MENPVTRVCFPHL